jgi:hypothetical protein
MAKIFLCILIVSGIVAAQPVGGGLKVGVPLTDAFKLQPFPTFAAFSADAHRFVVGPYVEVRLPVISLEVDALYRTYEFSNAGTGSSASSWEFPVLLKHKMLPGPVKPYFEAGLSFSRLSDIRALAVNHRSNYGFVVGGGVELHLLSLKISPEVRYNGWAFRNFDSLIQSHRNQFTLLVGFGF